MTGDVMFGRRVEARDPVSFSFNHVHRFMSGTIARRTYSSSDVGKRAPREDIDVAKTSSLAKSGSNVDVTGGVAGGMGPKVHELPEASEEVRPVTNDALRSERLPHKLETPLSDGLRLSVVLDCPLDLLDQVREVRSDRDVVRERLEVKLPELPQQ